jgi:hypothetical protein
LYAGRLFRTASGVAPTESRNGTAAAWSALSSGVYGTANPRVTALSVFDDGTGPALYAAGDFTFAGGVYANGIAKWDGASWSPLAGGGSGFSPSPIEALTVFDDGGGPALYACGGFTFAGTTAANGIAKWDGAAWSALGSGLTSTSFTFDVGAMTVFDDGTGRALYVSGQFSHAGGSQVNGIARWNGSSWSGVGAQGMGFLTHDVHALSVFDDGTGATLYAGGRFSYGQPYNFARGIVKWNGTAWNELGGGVEGSREVFALAVYDDGSGSALHVGGDFTTTSGGLVLSNAAKWNGSSWSSLGNRTERLRARAHDFRRRNRNGAVRRRRLRRRGRTDRQSRRALERNELERARQRHLWSGLRVRGVRRRRWAAALCGRRFDGTDREVDGIELDHRRRRN